VFARPSLGEAAANMTVADFSILIFAHLTCFIITMHCLPDIITVVIPFGWVQLSIAP
jgi:hypothetical protein